jgi:hypothetical protein
MIDFKYVTNIWIYIVCVKILRVFLEVFRNLKFKGNNRSEAPEVFRSADVS